MKYTTLPNTDIKISKICLGTMTFGEQNTEAEGHEQMSYALDQGINFFDTAEMYSIPGRKETQGSTERIIGTWFEKTGNRDKVILATKVTGPSGMNWISDNLGFSKERINDAIDKSLGRLKTDYVDLYQLHWPERKTNYFGQRGYTKHDAEWEDNFAEAIETLNKLKSEGKIKHWGLSNETPWGVARTLEESKSQEVFQPITIQNPYNLLNRLFEVGLAEMSIRSKVGLLAYSPLGFGVLSGKYVKGEDTARDRINKFKQYARYNSEKCQTATRAYLAIAEKYGMSLTQMALSFVTSRPFLTANIIGATSMDQLRENIGSINVNLSKECLTEIDAVYEKYPNPAP